MTGGTPAAGGLPAGDLPASGLPADGLPASGLPADGLPASDLPADGLPAGGLPARSRGVIALLEENCTVCMLCARECPDWCIYIESHKEPVPGHEPGGGPDPARAPAGRGRQRVRNVLDRFAIDFSLCMYCGICVEACPYDALFWSPEFSYAENDIAALTHEQGRLREWMWTVPPPPAHDPGAPAPRGGVPLPGDDAPPGEGAPPGQDVAVPGARDR